MSENTKWFSQTTLTFKDKQYATDGYLRVSLSSNTEDYRFFNPPLFNISITNQHQKSCNLNIQNAEDLLESFTVALKQLNGDDTIIEKHYQKNTNIYFKFAMASSTEERVVVMEIISSETDAVKIIVPLKPTFQSFLRRLKFFVENYDSMCFQLMNKAIDTETVNIIHQLPSLIKGISSQIVSQIPAEVEVADSRASDAEKVAVHETSENMYDFEQFLGDEMENIKIPEIEEEKASEEKPIVEVKSDFVDKVLRGDLVNLENKLSSFAASESPLLDLAADLESTLGFKMLNGITDDDMKSVSYTSAFFYNLYAKGYTINETPIPSGTPCIKFKGKATEKNLEFAKDMLVFIGYIRTLRRRLETKVTNAYDNKAILYLTLRCLMDPFCFSYVDGATRNDILSAIKVRYEYFDQCGLFDRYKSLIEMNGCASIDVTDITAYAEELMSNIIGKTPTIDEFHPQMVISGNMKLPTKNIFTLEQIINEFVPVEIAQLLGADFKNKDVVEKIKEQYNVSDIIMNFFLGEKKASDNIKAKPKKITPLQRWVEKFKQDIPDKYREEVIQHSKDMQYGIFDFSKSPWPMEEFDENIIKAFYVWDPNADERMKNNYQHFASLIKDETMTKDAILISTKVSKSSEWDILANV